MQAEKEEVERRKREEEIREAKRQQMKLNFLLTQTELYSHFIAKNVTVVGEALPQIVGNKEQELTGIKSIDEEFDHQAMEERAMQVKLNLLFSYYDWIYQFVHARFVLLLQDLL